MVTTPRGVAVNDEGGLTIELMIALLSHGRDGCGRVDVSVFRIFTSINRKTSLSAGGPVARPIRGRARRQQSYSERDRLPGGRHHDPASASTRTASTATTTSVQADVGIPDGLFVGAAGPARGERDVTIARTRDPEDHKIGPGHRLAPVAMSDGIFTSLLFEYFDASHNSTAAAGSAVRSRDCHRPRASGVPGCWRSPPRSKRTCGDHGDNADTRCARDEQACLIGVILLILASGCAALAVSGRPRRRRPSISTRRQARAAAQGGLTAGGSGGGAAQRQRGWHPSLAINEPWWGRTVTGRSRRTTAA
jgi:hypothetical protein